MKDKDLVIRTASFPDARSRERARCLLARDQISAIYVLNSFQRHSIGTRLLYAMASDLSKRGFRSGSLWVLRDNAPARRFYERYGGEIIAEREEVEADSVLVEVAYGWTDLLEVARLTTIE